jgi:hypothetical protein
MTKGSAPVCVARIGELLVGSGITDGDSLAQALHLAKKAACPVGRILQLSGTLKERDLKNALDAQFMIREGEISAEYAIKILHTAHTACLPFKEALQRHGWQQDEKESLGEIAELLMMTGTISEDDLRQAVERSEQIKLPLGRTLVLIGLVQPYVMAAVLNALIMIRNGQITHDEAIRGVLMSIMKHISLEQALVMEGTFCAQRDHSIRLGELLSQAGIVTESDNLYAVEMGLLSKQPLGQVLCEAGLVTPFIVEAALELQQMVTAGLLEARQACDVLKLILQTGVSVADAVSHKKRNGNQCAHLLKLAGFITDYDFQRAQALANGSTFDLAQCLYDAFIIDELLLRTANRCMDLIRQNVVKIEQAIIVLHFCVRTRASVEEALQELAFESQAEAC